MLPSLVSRCVIVIMITKGGILSFFYLNLQKHKEISYFPKRGTDVRTQVSLLLAHHFEKLCRQEHSCA